MRTALLPAVCCLSLAMSLPAQNHVTTHQVGYITYYGGTLNGEAVTGSAQQIGTTIFYNLTVGGRPVNYTKQVIGSRSHGQDSDGASSASQATGGERYASTSETITYTTDRIGDVIYTRGSNGCVNTTTIVEGQGFISGNCPR